MSIEMSSTTISGTGIEVGAWVFATTILVAAMLGAAGFRCTLVWTLGSLIFFGFSETPV